MKIVAASTAMNKFGEVIDMAQTEPVRIQRQGQDVAVVLSPDEFRRLTDSARGLASAEIEKLHAKSVKRRAKVYQALAK